MSLLVDPLAAFFRHELSKTEPLVLDSTEVEVELLPPLARVAITRRFSNTSCSLLEAVLTLPPTAQHEVVFGLTVTINGAVYHARARHHTDASSAHNAAIAEGRRAILYELIADVVQLVSIAGIEAGAQVAVRIESIRPLNRPDDDTATLHISLTAELGRVNRRLSDADALLTMPNTHDATLTVVAEGLKVMLNDPQRLISPGESCPIDCRETIALHITALGDRSLDYSCRHVESPGGWEASSRPSAEGFSQPMQPSGSVTSNRTDWMFGRMDTADREIRITAPMPDRDGDALSPNARATAAFAAAALAGAARRHDPERRSASVLPSTLPIAAARR
ncbi:hypothetical protein IY145_00680 [Methylosinus sp. H3A]|uniref:VIT domain-containing protein n=1 Tax=Methylosinus sp. H3A TaxID=2785786 RepID=UPI0018C24085|nr:VIT domain-containing protein [Methylosinus sp. H3A]MBG0807946.1 hypothetical protein [Methylosinus sp. H3A]